MNSTYHQKPPSSRPEMTFATPLKHITIKTLVNKTFTFDVDANDTLQMMKTKIKKKEGIPQIQQRLIFGIGNVSGTKEWRDNLTLEQIGAKEGEIVYLILKLAEGSRTRDEDILFTKLSGLPDITIVVRTSSDKRFGLKIHPSETVWKLKLRIQDREGIPASQQRVVSGEKELEDIEWLAKYDLSEGSVVRVQSTAFEQELSKLLKRVAEDMKKFVLEH